MNTWGRICLLCVAAGLVFTVSPRFCPAQEKVVTLDQVLELALKRNPGITASAQEVEASRAKVTQAESAYLPQVSSQANVARERQWYSSTGQVPGFKGTHEEYNDYNTSLSVSQYIYDFGKTAGAVEQSQHDLLASQKGLHKTGTDVVRDVKNAYFEVLKKMELVGVNEESLRTQERHLAQARAMHQAGTRPKIDVTKALVERAKTKLRLITATYDVKTAKVKLENVLGGPPVEGEYTVAEHPHARPTTITDPDPLFQEALKGRPEVLRLQARVKAAEAQLKTARAGYWPSINAGASYGWGNTEFPLEDNWEVGASLQWEIFSGLKTQGEIREAMANLAGIRAQLKQEELQVIQEVSQAFIAVNESAERIKTAQIALGEARENMELAEGRYRMGVGDAIEYSDAQLLLTEARSDLVQATYEHFQDLADLDRALGRGYQR